MEQRRDYKKIFKEKWYSEEEIKIHYEYINYKNLVSRNKIKEIKIAYKEEFEKAKKYFTKVNPSTKWDWLWVTNHYWRMFIYWEDLDDYIKNHSNINK